MEVPGGHIEHLSCALNSWYDPIGQSLHFPVALSKYVPSVQLTVDHKAKHLVKKFL